MSYLGGLLNGDDTRGKKSDDHKKTSDGATVLPIAWSAKQAKSPIALTRRRILYLVLLLIAAYFFFENVPSDLGPAKYTGRPDYSQPPPGSSNSKQAIRPPPPTDPRRPVDEYKPPAEAPPRGGESTEGDDHYFNGRIRFYKLAASLHPAASSSVVENVVFAASSLHSASKIIPLACAMGSQKRNNVHVLLMGRDDLEIDEIKDVNGVDEKCNVAWHDGRPDYSRWSSDYRMEVSVAAALGHVDNFIEPVAVISDGSGTEDSFFTSSMRRKTNELSKVLIELPEDAIENLMWITRLDCGSLAAWQTTYVEILIHAPRDSSGSLVRLLRSIEEADYFNYRRPHLTIELPEKVDDASWEYIQELTWPTLSDGSTAHQSQVTIRHRIPRGLKDSDEATAHTVESFYPARPMDSNVLLLSPQAQLSPLYYHYTMYALLEYKYSINGRGREINDVLGISLELPLRHLNDSQVLDPPTVLASSSGSSLSDSSSSEEGTPFLWQAPNSNAALYFGDKWMEFHSYLTRRLAAAKMQTTPKYDKQVSDKYPSWLEYMVELMRTRGYTMLYPNFGANGIVTVHQDLYQEPEETKSRRRKSSDRSKDFDKKSRDPDPSQPLVVEPSDFSRHHSSSSERPLLEADLLSLYPDSSGPLPGLATLPLLSYQGIPMNAARFTTTSRNYATDFRREIGHCGSDDDQAPRAVPFSAADLFCDIPGFEQDSTANDMKDDEPVKPLPIIDNNPIVLDEYVPPDPEPDQADSSANTQNEFEAHLQRQSSVGKKSSSTTEESKDRAEGNLNPEAKDSKKKKPKEDAGHDRQSSPPVDQVDPRKIAVKGGQKGQVWLSDDDDEEEHHEKASDENNEKAAENQDGKPEEDDDKKPGW